MRTQEKDKEKDVGFPCSTDGKESACNAGDLALIPGSGRSPGEGNGNPLQYSCLVNSMDRPWGRKESDMTDQLTHIVWQRRGRFKRTV